MDAKSMCSRYIYIYIEKDSDSGSEINMIECVNTIRVFAIGFFVYSLPCLDLHIVSGLNIPRRI